MRQHERIERLEKRVTVLTRALCATVLVAGAAALLAAKSQPTTVRAEQLVLVDSEGQERLVLTGRALDKGKYRLPPGLYVLTDHGWANQPVARLNGDELRLMRIPHLKSGHHGGHVAYTYIKAEELGMVSDLDSHQNHGKSANFGRRESVLQSGALNLRYRGRELEVSPRAEK